METDGGAYFGLSQAYPYGMLDSVITQRGKKNDKQNCDMDVLHRLCAYARRNHAPVYGYVRAEG